MIHSRESESRWSTNSLQLMEYMLIHLVSRARSMEWWLSLSPGIFLTQGSNPESPALRRQVLRQILYQWPQGKPKGKWAAGVTQCCDGFILLSIWVVSFCDDGAQGTHTPRCVLTLACGLFSASFQQAQDLPLCPPLPTNICLQTINVFWKCLNALKYQGLWDLVRITMTSLPFQNICILLWNSSC